MQVLLIASDIVGGHIKRPLSLVLLRVAEGWIQTLPRAPAQSPPATLWGQQHRPAAHTCPTCTPEQK